MAIASLLILGSLWVLVRVRGGAAWLCGGRGRYAGLEKAHQMQPQPQPQSYPQPYYGVAQPVQQQQWAPYPVQHIQHIQHIQQIPKNDPTEASAYR
jgi:hypothetical protein